MIHSFNVEIAEEYGIPSAIILHLICKIIRDNEENGIPQYKGRTWAAQSVKDLTVKLPYLSKNTICRAVDDLVKGGLLDKRLSRDMTDRSSLYALTEKALTFLPEAVTQNGAMDLPKTGEWNAPKRVNGFTQNGEIGETVTGQGFEGNREAEKRPENDVPEDLCIYNIFNINKDIDTDKDTDKDTDQYTDKNTDKNNHSHTEKHNVGKADERAAVRREIIDYLNRKAGTKYRDGAIAQKHINARLNEGYTVEDFKTVIDSKCAEWLRTDMAKYLRPETLFGTKMDGYLGQAGMKTRTVGPNGIAMDPDLLEDEELKKIFG